MLGLVLRLTSMMLPSAVLGTTMNSRDRGGMLSGSAAMSVSGCLVTVPERLQPGQNAAWVQAWNMLPVATGLRWQTEGTASYATSNTKKTLQTLVREFKTVNECICVPID